jgi:hypothetical protein
MQIRTPDTGCLMYEEVQSQDLRNTGGVFSLTINDGTGSRTDVTGLTLDRIFANRGTFNLDLATCSTGPASYSPAPGDGRNLVVLFKDETMTTWEPIPPQKINFVPYAFEAKQIAGFTADSLLRVVNGSGDPLTGLAPLSNAQYTALLDLINGSSAAYTKAGQLNGVALPTMTTGEVLGWNGTAWVSQAATSGPNSITTTMIQNGAVDGTKLDPAISISTSGMIASAVTTTRDFKIYAASPSNFYVGMLADPTLAASYTLTWPLNAGAANQVLTTDGSGKLTWTTPSSAGITDLTGDVTASGPGSAAATIANNAITTSKINDKAITYAKIQDVTSGKLLGRSSVGAGAVEEISVGTGLSFSGGILSSTASDSFSALPCGDGYVPYKSAGSWTCKAVDAGNTSGAIVARDSFGSFIANNAKLTNLSLDNGSSVVTLQNLAGSNYTLTLPATAGSGNQVLTTDGLGGLSWTTPSTDVGGSGTANFVPKFTATRTLGDSLIYDDGARVGIGTTSANSTLTVAGNITPDANATRALGSSSFGYSQIYGNYLTTTSGSTLTLNGGAHQFQISNSTKMVLTNTGNVGIGTTAPATKLDVNGSVNATQLCIAGSCMSSWPSAGLTNFSEAVNTATPNATIPVVSLTANNAATNVDVALSPKGLGALTAQVADNATTGGTKRGQNAVDLQMIRVVASQTASGNQATIGGGYGNTASGTMSTVPGGSGNNASGSYSFASGQSNTASGNWSSAGGYSSTAAGSFSFAFGQSVTADSANQVTIGAYNMPKGSEDPMSWNGSDPLFVIGNGTGSGASRSTAMMVLKNGNVGIGTTAPAYKLDVAGDVNITGNFKVNGTNIATGGGDFKSDGTVAMTGALRSAVGTAALPGITFNGDTNTGLSAATADNLVFSTAGFERLKIDGSGVVTTPFLSSLGVGGTPTRKIEAFASAGGLYASSSTSRESPGTANNGMRLTVGNGIDNQGTFYEMNIRNYNNVYQNAYIGGISNASGYAPTIVFGQQTGATAYDERMRIDTAGNVGIGTTLPDTKLMVAGTLRVGDGGETCAGGNFTGGIRYNGGNLQFCDGTAWTTLGTGSGSGDFKADGTVAMTGAFRAINGTTGAPSIAFENYTGSGFSASSGGNIELSITGTQTASVSSSGITMHGAGRGLSTSSSGGFQVTGGGTSSATVPTYTFNNDTNLGIFRAGTDILGFTTNGTEKMRIDASGNVGIGTTSPNGKLDVKGSIVMSGATSGYAGFQPAAAAGSTVWTLPSADGTSGQILSTDGSGVLSWTSAGGGGDFKSDGTVSMTGVFKASNGSAAAPSIAFDSNANTGMYRAAANKIGFSTNGASRMVIDNTGVGIGKTSANAPLDVGGLINTDEGLLVGGYGALENTDDTLKINFTSGAFNVGIYPGSVGPAAIWVRNPTGEVGIGTTSPNAKFDVKGAIVMSGATSGYTGFQPPTAAGSTIWTLPSSDGASGQVMKTDGAGTLSWVSVSDTLAGLSCSSGQVPSWNGSAWVCVSTSVSNSNNTLVLRDGSGNVGANVATVNGLALSNGASSTITLTTPTAFSSYSLQLPSTYGANGDVLTSDGAGNASWAPASGSGLWTTHATNISYDGTGNVGIGTTAPAYKLDVTGDVNVTGNFKVNGVNLSTGGGDFKKDGSVAMTGDLQLNRYINGGNTGNVIDTGTSAGNNFDLRTADADLRLRTINNNSIMLITNATERMRVTQAGNVGIGTTSPSYKLDVNGIANATQLCIAGDCKSTWPSGGGGLPAADGTAGAPSISFTADSNTGLYRAGADTLAVAAGGISVMGFSSGGVFNSVPITSDIAGTAAAPAYGFSASNGAGMFLTGGSANDLGFAANGSEGMRIAASGNVGIGTTAPAYNLQISGINPVLSLFESSSSTDLNFQATSNGLNLRKGVTSYFTFDTNGKYLGIGTTPITGNSITMSAGGKIGTSRLNNNNTTLEATGADVGGSDQNGGTLILKSGISTGTGSSNIAFYTASSAPSGTSDNAQTLKMTILGNGNVGIGTTSPNVKLHVSDSANTYLRLESTGGSSGIYANYASGSAGGLYFWGASILRGGVFADTDHSVVLKTQNSTPLRFLTGNVEKMRITASGNIGIGTSSPTQTLEVNGTVLASAYLYSSDRRLKKDITPLEESLEKLLTLNTVKFNWITPHNSDEERTQIGLIAQDVQKVFPEAVKEDSQGWLRMNYQALISPIIDGMREMYHKIMNVDAKTDALQARVSDLEAKNKALEERLSRLEKALDREPASAQSQRAPAGH